MRLWVSAPHAQITNSAISFFNHGIFCSVWKPDTSRAPGVMEGWLGLDILPDRNKLSLDASVEFLAERAAAERERLSKSVASRSDAKEAKTPACCKCLPS
mmetsp:Transcript_28907/g.43444  ORF Transcript_28907/g.43444 Transcript_28907/m.43444 type:complete len:100 (-) Transcript_28907:234-533(-)